MTDLEAYYNKFNEEKRLDSRHGRVEFFTSMHYIHQSLTEIMAGRKKEELHILDIGAGTGRYSVPLAQEGYDVTAVELVKHNLGRLKQKGAGVHAYQGNALNLKRFSDNSFDLTLLFGPMYHLHGKEDKLRALKEAVRVTKPGGRILVAYIMNEFSVITYAFKECSRRITTVRTRQIRFIPWCVWKILQLWMRRWMLRGYRSLLQTARQTICVRF